MKSWKARTKSQSSTATDPDNPPDSSGTTSPDVATLPGSRPTVRRVGISSTMAAAFSPVISAAVSPAVAAVDSPAMAAAVSPANTSTGCPTIASAVSPAVNTVVSPAVRVAMSPATIAAAISPAAMARAAAASKRSDSRLARCGRALKRIVLTVMHSERSWVVVMLVLGTLDVLLNLVNFIQMSDKRLGQYGLVIGPPTTDLWIALCVFTVVGILLYIVETGNTLSALRSDTGDTSVSIDVELIVTLLFEHIPLATVDYFIARSRRQYTTKVETTCNSMRIIFIFMRLVWYAHIEGRKIRKNDKHEIKQILVMICCLLFSVSLAFCIMNWKNEPKGILRDYHLKNVSIYLLHGLSPPEKETYTMAITDRLLEQGWKRGEEPSLIRSAWKIYDERLQGGSEGSYNCRHNKTKPHECRLDTIELRFHFVYSSRTLWSPYGEIWYNYARVCPLSQPNVTCEDAQEPVAGDWKVMYFETVKDHGNGTGLDEQLQINISNPFRKVQTAPMPTYRPDIKVCPSTAGVGRGKDTDGDGDKYVADALDCLGLLSTTAKPPRRNRDRKKTINRPLYDYIDDYIMSDHSRRRLK